MVGNCHLSWRRQGGERGSTRGEAKQEKKNPPQTQRFLLFLIIMDTTSTVSQGSKNTLIYTVLIQPRDCHIFSPYFLCVSPSCTLRCSVSFCHICLRSLNSNASLHPHMHCPAELPPLCKVCNGRFSPTFQQQGPVKCHPFTRIILALLDPCFFFFLNLFPSFFFSMFSPALSVS